MNVEPFSLGLVEPLGTAAGTVERREGFVVRVEVDGVTGVGEATPLPGWTEDRVACRAALDAAASAVSDAANSAVSDATASAVDDATADPAAAALDAVDPMATPAAHHGVELAVLDARARAAGVPLRAVLRDGGDGAPDTVAVNATVGDADPESTAAAAADAVDEGFGAVKVKVGARGLEADHERLRAVREAVGPAVELRADANGAWSDLETARRALDALADVGVRYVEQPLPAADLAGHAALRGGPVGVALDESLAAEGLSAILDAGAADVAVLKPMALGGPARALDVARRARRGGVPPVVTTTVDAVHARTAAVHLAAALDDLPACGLATGAMLAEDLADDPAPVEDGRIHVPTGPGNLGGAA